MFGSSFINIVIIPIAMWKLSFSTLQSSVWSCVSVFSFSSCTSAAYIGVGHTSHQYLKWKWKSVWSNKMLVFSFALSARAQHILGLGTQREKESGLPRSAHLRGDPISLWRRYIYWCFFAESTIPTKDIIKLNQTFKNTEKCVIDYKVWHNLFFKCLFSCTGPWLTNHIARTPNNK